DKTKPNLDWLFSRGSTSPKKREKNSSIGSLEPLRGERCAVVEMFTTTGMVFLAMGENDGGRLSRAARLAATARGIPKALCKRVPANNGTTAVPYKRTNEFRFCTIRFLLLRGASALGQDSKFPLYL